MSTDETNRETNPVKGEGRRAKRQRVTRAALLKAAYETMSTGGIDAARIKDITEKADIGFGTFYNYFADKDAVARAVLDCMIHNIGERIRAVTLHLRDIDPALMIGVANRLALRAAMGDPIWQWWALRPDLLFDRMVKGLGPFAMDDVRDAIGAGVTALSLDEVQPAWALATWVMVGGIHDVAVGKQAPESEAFVARSIMQLLGFHLDAAERATITDLPAYGALDIDWDFVLDG